MMLNITHETNNGKQTRLLSESVVYSFTYLNLPNVGEVRGLNGYKSEELARLPKHGHEQHMGSF